MKIIVVFAFGLFFGLFLLLENLTSLTIYAVACVVFEYKKWGAFNGFVSLKDKRK